jgi:hypothetical protein
MCFVGVVLSCLWLMCFWLFVTAGCTTHHAGGPVLCPSPVCVSFAGSTVKNVSSQLAPLCVDILMSSSEL